MLTVLFFIQGSDPVSGICKTLIFCKRASEIVFRLHQIRTENDDAVWKPFWHENGASIRKSERDLK